ncbi:MAG TPA: hypothetical protein VD969_24590 [Symbiobacteriaceae bacterium]|nr:hypothetical protein [Symbiobacteriaceae bacterium]
MSKRNVLVVSVVGGILIVLTAALGLWNIAKAKSRSSSSAPTGQVHLAQEEVKTNDGGGIQVQVTYHAGVASLQFEISLNTHSVELGKYDLSKLSQVSLDPGGTLNDAEWKPEGTGAGHHVTGILSFKDPNGLLAGAKAVKLEIRDLAEVPVRQFEWQKK